MRLSYLVAQAIAELFSHRRHGRRPSRSPSVFQRARAWLHFWHG